MNILVKTSIFPTRTEQASSINELLLWLFTNLWTAKRILLVNARYKDDRRFSSCHFAKIIGKKEEQGFEFIQSCPLS